MATNTFAVLGHQVFSFGDLVSLALKAGFAGMDANIAAAIALAESSGNPDAIGDVTLGISVGLWQINLKAHPNFTRFGLVKPQNNANAAFEVYSDARKTFEPWSTFKSGAYLKHMPSASSLPSVGTPEESASPVHPASAVETKPIPSAPAKKSATPTVSTPASAPAPLVKHRSFLEAFGHFLVNDGLPVLGKILPLIPFPGSGIVGAGVTEADTILEEKEKQ